LNALANTLTTPRLKVSFTTRQHYKSHSYTDIYVDADFAVAELT
jgi:hypothetical protein